MNPTLPEESRTAWGWGLASTDATPGADGVRRIDRRTAKGAPGAVEGVG
ncbi:MAG: hypothetical protein PUF97_01900 [Bifidobacteriaceae bacterium]|nr:hypothetical protein [Bifidobacteriaceae bacterium]